MRQCGNVLRNVRKWTYCSRASPLISPRPRVPRLHMSGLFANVASNCQTSSSHFLRIPLIPGGKHQLPPLDFSPILPLFFPPSSIWLSPVHFLLRLPAPDPVGSAQPAAGRWKPAGAESPPSSCAINGRCQSQDQRTVSIYVFCFVFCFVFVFIEVIFISDQCKC